MIFLFTTNMFKYIAYQHVPEFTVSTCLGNRLYYQCEAIFDRAPDSCCQVPSLTHHDPMTLVLTNRAARGHPAPVSIKIQSPFMWPVHYVLSKNSSPPLRTVTRRYMLNRNLYVRAQTVTEP